MKHYTQLPEIYAPVPWTVRDIISGVLIWGVLLSSFSLFVKTLQLPIDPSLVIIIGEAILLLPTWYFTIYKYGANWGDLGLRPFSPLAVGVGISLIVVFFMFQLIYINLLTLFGQKIPNIDETLKNISFFPLLFIGVTIIAPFVEETFFRGFIFACLRDKWGWQWSVIVSAGLFALAHIIPISILPMFFLGIILALITQFSGSIWPAILIHVLNNFIALLG
jgi:membrane protease YdiL (CAAX protease family)